MKKVDYHDQLAVNRIGKFIRQEREFYCEFRVQVSALRVQV